MLCITLFSISANAVLLASVRLIEGVCGNERLALRVSVERAATSFGFEDDLVLTHAVGRCFVRLTPVVKEESVPGRLG